MLGVVLALSLLICATAAILLRKKALSSTPYERLKRRVGRNRGPRQPSERVYDVFLSYKSEDVMVVRQLAEQLIANRIAVWFAEYTIGVQERPSFQEAIDSGIQAAKYGVCFTNDRYVGSQYCRDEVEKMLAPGNCGPENVIELRFPTETLPHQMYPQLALSHSTEYQGIDEALQHIVSVAGLPIRHSPPSSVSAPERRTFHYHDQEYSIDLAGWNCIGGQYLAPGDPDVEGPKFVAMFDGSLMWAHVLIGPQDVSRAPIEQGSLDDRAYYEEAIKFADTYFKSIWPQKLVGVHLLFALGYSHMALTTLFKPGIWSRLYSVVVPLSGNTGDAELAFFFFFKGSFMRFCRYASRMDALVASLKVHL